MQSMDNGEDGWKVELMSVRDNKKPIPIRLESEGIIKIARAFRKAGRSFRGE